MAKKRSEERQIQELMQLGEENAALYRKVKNWCRHIEIQLEASVSQLVRLPPIHRDPFDRILICQAMKHGLTIVTVDDIICNYPVTVLNHA